MVSTGPETFDNRKVVEFAVVADPLLHESRSSSAPTPSLDAEVTANPNPVPSGGSTELTVKVLSNNAPVTDANVYLDVGGGNFNYPCYSVPDCGGRVAMLAFSGVTDYSGTSTAIWYPYTSFNGEMGYVFNLRVSKQGFKVWAGNLEVRVVPRGTPSSNSNTTSSALIDSSSLPLSSEPLSVPSRGGSIGEPMGVKYTGDPMGVHPNS
jgi:hypothetical protein